MAAPRAPLWTRVATGFSESWSTSSLRPTAFIVGAHSAVLARASDDRVWNNMLFFSRLCCEHPNGEEVLALRNTSQIIMQSCEN